MGAREEVGVFDYQSGNSQGILIQVWHMNFVRDKLEVNLTLE